MDSEEEIRGTQAPGLRGCRKHGRRAAAKTASQNKVGAPEPSHGSLAFLSPYRLIEDEDWPTKSFPGSCRSMSEDPEARAPGCLQETYIDESRRGWSQSVLHAPCN